MVEMMALVAVVVAAVVQLHGVLRAAGQPPRADADGPDASILRVDLASRGRGR